MILPDPKLLDPMKAQMFHSTAVVPAPGGAQNLVETESIMREKTCHHARILIIDDDINGSIKLLTDVLRFDGYTNLRSLSDPRGALTLLIEYQPDLVILDLNMPYLDGFQILDLTRSFVGDSDYLPVLIVTDDDDASVRHRALASGAVDFLNKPFEAREICLRVGNMLQVRFKYLHLQRQNRVLEEEVLHRTREMEGHQLELKEAQLETIHRLARAVEHHDNDTAQHTQRVALTCSLLAQSLGLPEEQIALLRYAAPLHDVGKIGIPESVILKPGLFTEAERKIMQRHCAIGADLLSGGRSELLHVGERIALTHHEKWDGSGYPRELKGDEISIEGRILAVADVFDALIHERPYKKAWPVDEAVAEIRDQSGRHFDPDVVDAFMELPYADLV